MKKRNFIAYNYSELEYEAGKNNWYFDPSFRGGKQISKRTDGALSLRGGLGHGVSVSRSSSIGSGENVATPRVGLPPPRSLGGRFPSLPSSNLPTKNTCRPILFCCPPRALSPNLNDAPNFHSSPPIATTQLTLKAPPEQMI